MININDLLQTLKANVNPAQGGHIRPSQNFVRWVNEISEELFEALANDFEKSSMNSDKLAPFLRSVNVPLVAQPGKSFDTFPRPTDFRYRASARFLSRAGADGTTTGVGCKGKDVLDAESGNPRRYVDEDEQVLNAINEGSADKEAPVEYVDNQRWGSVTQHKTKGPSLKSPKFTTFDEGFKVMPRGLGIIVFDYFRSPVPAVYNYTIGADDTEIFNSSGSTHLEWGANMIPEFISRLAIRYGVYVHSEFNYQAGQQQRAQTKS